MSQDDSQFELSLIALRRQIEELEGYPEESGRRRELKQLRRELELNTEKVFRGLSPWQVTLVARHPDRPYTLDYIEFLMDEWVELHGDRGFADDPAIVGGLARYHGRSVMVIGHQKGRTTQERIERNFGQPRPEGYRKALRLMKLAERFGLPLVTFIDTPGAFPGKEGEERGQHEAIARNLLEMAALRIPIASVVTGEGGSGGALALGVANHISMLEYAMYSVITPEGCAAILWRDQERRADAAAAMRITAPDLLRLGIIDQVVAEPLGGAHTDAEAAARLVDGVLGRALDGLCKQSADELVAQRYQRFRAIGAFTER